MANKLIINLSHVNPKSLDIELGYSPIDIQFKLYNEDDSFKVDLTLISNSVNPLFKTLSITSEDEDDTSDDSLLMSPDTNYVLKAFKNEILVDTAQISFNNSPAPLLPKVTAYGNRLLEIQFEYPIKHLDDTSILSSTIATIPIGNIPTPGKQIVYASSNFYIKYFKEDSNQSNTANPKWPGYLLPRVSFKYGSPEDETTLSEPFTILQSDDQRTLLIQSNIRSLPLGFHNLQIATSKIADHSLSGLHLADFLNRDVPISEIEFEFKGAEYSATVQTVSITDPQTVEVVFSSPVIDIQGKITVDSISSTRRASLNESVSVTRKPETLNTLIFKMAPDTFITPGPNTITISDVIDCYGLLINHYKYTSNLELPRPVILSILQDKTIDNPLLTKVDVTFSHEMNEASVSNIENYSIFSDVTLIPIKSVLFDNLKPTKLTLEFTPQLSSGAYTLIANNLIDIYGSPLENTPYDFSIVDTTRPFVSSIIGTNVELPEDINDTILIKFSEPMAINTEHGIDKGVNFKLSPDGTNFKTLENSKITILKNNTWARFNLKDVVPLIPINPGPTSLIKTGYIGLDKVFFITDSSGNIVEFCIDKKIDKLLPILNLDGGLASITDSNEITYTLNTTLDIDAMFDTVVYKEDFIFKTDSSSPLEIVSVTVLDNLKTLVFTFNNITFSSGTDYTMSLDKVNRKILSEDILNRPINLTAPITVKNNLRPEVLSISTVWVDNVSEPNEAILALRLSSLINITHVNDFLVYNRNNLRLNVSKATITDENTGLPSLDGKILELYCKSPVNTNALANDLSVSTAPEAYRITGFHSSDAYSKLKSIENYMSSELYPIASNVILGTNLFSSKFEVMFTEPIDILEAKNPDGTINVTCTLVSTEGPSSIDPSKTEPFVSIHLNDIFELRSNIRSYLTDDNDTRDDSILIPSVAGDPTATLRSITKPGSSYSFNALLSIEDTKLSITFIDTVPPSDILRYFENEFVLFELLPLGYKLFGTNSGASLNESITVKFPFKFPII
ncbi:MAG: hypothetical protein ACRC30_16050 [Clostridium sp.]